MEMNGTAERANAQLFITDLCDVLDVNIRDQISRIIRFYRIVNSAAAIAPHASATSNCRNSRAKMPAATMHTPRQRASE